MSETVLVPDSSATPVAATAASGVAASGAAPAPLRVGVDALRFVPCTDGRHETLLRGMVRTLAATYQDDSFTVFANHEGSAALAEDLRPFPNVTLVALPVDASRPAACASQADRVLPKALHHNPIDVLWAPYGSLPSRLPVPGVVTYTVLPADAVLPPPDRLPAFLHRFLDPPATRTLRTAARLTVLSECTRQELLRRGDVRFDRTAVLPVAADEALDAPLPPDFLSDRMTALLRNADPFLLALSDSHRDSGLPTLVEAFGKLSPDLPHRLVVVGRPGKGEEAFQKALTARPCSDRITRLEYVSRKDLAALLQMASAFVEPAHHESTGYSVVEAMASGVPVVATRADAIPEIGGEVLRYADIGDAESLATALRDILLLPLEVRAECVARQRDRARKFTWGRSAESLMALLRQSL